MDIKELKLMIAGGKEEKVIAAILRSFKEEPDKEISKALFDEVVTLNARHNSNETRYRKGLLGNDEFAREENSIREELLDLINRIAHPERLKVEEELERDEASVAAPQNDNSGKKRKIRLYLIIGISVVSGIIFGVWLWDAIDKKATEKEREAMIAKADSLLMAGSPGAAYELYEAAEDSAHMVQAENALQDSLDRVFAREDSVRNAFQDSLKQARIDSLEKALAESVNLTSNEEASIREALNEAKNPGEEATSEEVVADSGRFEQVLLFGDSQWEYFPRGEEGHSRFKGREPNSTVHHSGTETEGDDILYWELTIPEEVNRFVVSVGKTEIFWKCYPQIEAGEVINYVLSNGIPESPQVANEYFENDPKGLWHGAIFWKGNPGEEDGKGSEAFGSLVSPPIDRPADGKLTLMLKYTDHSSGLRIVVRSSEIKITEVKE